MIITNDNLLAEFRRAGRCEVCHRYCADGRDPHHVSARGLAGGKQLDVRTNLVSLCRYHHDQAHRGPLFPAEKDGLTNLELFEGIIADRESVPVEWVRECRYFLNRLDNDISAERLEEELAGRPEGFKVLVRREIGR